MATWPTQQFDLVEMEAAKRHRICQLKRELTHRLYTKNRLHEVTEPRDVMQVTVGRLGPWPARSSNIETNYE